MKQSLFARPNLKLMLAGALLLLLVVHFIDTVHSRPRRLLTEMRVQAAGDEKTELRLLLQEAAEFPTYHVLTQLCLLYERRGDYRKALHYLRQAEALAQLEEE